MEGKTIALYLIKNEHITDEKEEKDGSEYKDQHEDACVLKKFQFKEENADM